MNIGFTGTRNGMTKRQLDALRFLLAAMVDPDSPWSGKIALHHGDCIGADEQADKLAYAARILIEVYPPTDPKLRAFCPAEPMTRYVGPARPYLERNWNIVDSSDLLIAAPSTCAEELRSGTWATVRYARKQGKPIVILEP